MIRNTLQVSICIQCTITFARVFTIIHINYMYLHISTIVVCAMGAASSGSSLSGIVSSPPKLIHFVTSEKYRIDEVCHDRPLSVSGSIIYMYKMREHDVHYNNTPCASVVVRLNVSKHTKGYEQDNYNTL